MCTNRDLCILESGHDSVIARIIHKTLQITPEQQQAMHRMLRLLFYLLVLHTVLAFTSAFIFDEEIHQFIEGPLLYILIVLFFLTLFVKNRLLAKAPVRTNGYLS